MTDTISSAIEILERHVGDPMPDAGTGSIIAPNLLRINGDDIWSASDYPVEIGPIGFNPLGAEAVVVPVAMLVLLTEDDTPDVTLANRRVPPIATLDIRSGGIVLNGRAVFAAEQGVEILQRYPGTDCARVRLPLLARKVTIGDEPAPRSAIPSQYKWGPIGDNIDSLHPAA
jgi:hypothetical protein